MRFSKAAGHYLTQLGQTHAAEYVTAIAQQAETLATARGDLFVMLCHIFDARAKLALPVRRSRHKQSS